MINIIVFKKVYNTVYYIDSLSLIILLKVTVVYFQSTQKLSAALWHSQYSFCLISKRSGGNHMSEYRLC